MTGARHPNPTMSAIPEKWSWQMAEEALAHNKDNRHIRPSKVAQYARLMKNKMWGVEEAKAGYRGSVAPIIFDWNGVLSDGQHRLLAQVESRTTQYWYVLRDVPPTTQATVDNGIPRTAADLLGWSGYENANVLQGIARWAWMLERGVSGTGSVTVANEEIKKMVVDHPDLTHSAAMSGRIRHGTKFFDKLIGPTPLGAAHWWIAQFNDHIEADIFIERMVHMNREPDGSAILALWSRFNAARGDATYHGARRETIPLRTKLAMVVRTWNSDVSGKYVQKISSKSRTGVYMVPKPRKRRISQEESYGPLTDETSTEIDETDENEDQE